MLAEFARSGQSVAQARGWLADPGGGATIRGSDGPAGSIRVFLATSPVDLRRGFDGLAARTREVLEEEPLSGQLFAFRNRRGDRMKVLFFASGALCLFCERLERGTFELPAGDAARVEIAPGDLGLILEGLDLSSARRRPRWKPQAIAMR